MAKKKPDPYATQAANLTLTKYGPEVSALTALMRQAEADRDLRLRQATSGRQYAVGAVDQARPQVKQAYQGAQQAVSPAFAQGGGIEAQALQARLGESSALAQSQLAARRVSAVEGEGAARQAALRDFRTDQGKIGDRAGDLARESGAFTSQTITDLIGADAAAQAKVDSQNATLGQSERNSQRSAGIDPDTGQPIPGGKLDPAVKNAKKWASPTRQSAAADEIQRLLEHAKADAAAGETRGSSAQALLEGIPKASRPVYETVQVKHPNGTVTTKQQRKLDPNTGEPITHDDPGFDAAKSQLLASAALDMAYDGHLSRRNQKLLHDRGIQLGPLGLVTYQDWLKKQRAAARSVGGRAPAAPDGSGGSRPT